MKLDNYIDRAIGRKILEDNTKQQEGHKSSGKLSAGKLGDPLQWQILYVLGVSQKPIEEYTLRKFLRGKQVEDWLISNVLALETQKFVEYRIVVGYVDALVETKDWDFQNGVIPLEIKSTSNMKFKRIVKNGADRGHKLQAGLYALALNSPHYGVSYVATDDLRIQTYIYETADVKDEIDSIIDRFDEVRAKGIVPIFEPNESWQKNPDYQKYPEWAELSEEDATKKYREKVVSQT
jgi:CRISPR/Cas system-associated exonuclease Cas4 (RecB family)